LKILPLSSRGSASWNATVRGTIARTRLVRDSVGPRIGVKASGRFRTLEQLVDATGAGASRVSALLSATLARMAAEATPVPAAAR